ncbi:MAG: HAMP domain-containing protein [Alphaproteobacteria bacterium]|nr:HAMP domain-containing protein [Alphaproteobacteria bacterium]
MGEYKFSWRCRKLYVDILASFFFITFGTTLATTWYTYQSNSESLIRLSEDLLTHVSKFSVDKVISYLNQAQLITHLGADIAKDKSPVSNKNLPLIAFMEGILRSYPYLSSIYIGTEDGKFLQLKSLDSTSAYRTDPSRKLPGGSVSSIRYITREGGTATEIWQYQDAEGKILDHESVPKVMYNHLIRDWYVSVSQSRSSQWSDVYVFSSTKKPGITTGYPLIDDQGVFFGVIAVDIEMGSISEFLKESRVSKEYSAFILTEKEEVIASTDENQMVKVEGDKVRAANLNELSDKRVVLGYQKFRNEGKTNFTFQKDNIDYISSFSFFPKTFEKKWSIGIIVPLNTFIGSIKDTQRNILLITFLIFVISVALIGFIARRIARPIISLSEEATRIKNFELDNNQEVETDIYELQLLNNSISSMRMSMRAFSKFIPKVLVAKLLRTNQTVKIGGKLRRVTLLFSDVVNFTSVSETYPPEKLVVHLSEYFEEVTQIIMKANGTIDKYIGDAVMAFWGAPIVDKDQALNACRAALSLQHRLSHLNRRWAIEGKPVLETRIGIHTGNVIVGNMGSSDRMNYTALGDTVNLAARLEGANKMYHTHVIISEEVYLEIQEHCLVRPIDLVAVKGKTKAVRIYELVGLFHDDPSLLPTELQVNYCKLFTKAFQLYIERRWDVAINLLEDIKDRYGDDYMSSLYLERCNNFKENPPPEDWDGVIHLTEK